MKQFVYDLPITQVNTAKPEQDFGQFETDLGDYLGAVVEDTWNNATAMGSFQRRSEAMGTYTDALNLFGGDTQSVSIDTDAVRWETPMPLEEQNKLIEANGMKDKVKPYFVKGTNGTPDAGYTRETLDLLMQFRKDDDTNALLRENASNWYAPLGVGAMIGTSLLDAPGVLMTLATPVLGQARKLSMLGRASGAWGRAGVRALEGAISGAGAMAILEPTIVANREMWHDEWSPYESVLNIGMGAIIGAGLHSAFGAFGDRIRNKRGQRQPWQVLTPNAESERLRIEFRDNILDTVRRASENVKGVIKISDTVAEEAINALSGQFDVIARTVAYDLNKPLSEVYASLKPAFEVVNTVSEGVGQLGFARAVELAGKFNGSEIKPEIAVNELGQAAIKLFQNTTSEDIQRAFFTGYRRMMEMIAKSPDARESARIAYSQMEAFVNAEPGKPWTAAQEVRFQDAAMLFLKDKNAVPEVMAEAFEGMNQFMREMKLQAENTGVEVPRWLDDRLETLQHSMEERDAEFSRQVTDLANDTDIHPERTGIDTIDGLERQSQGGTELERLQRDVANAESQIEQAELLSEEIREALRAGGVPEETMDMLIDKKLFDEAVLAENRNTAFKNLQELIKQTADEHGVSQEVMNVLECAVQKFIGA